MKKIFAMVLVLSVLMFVFVQCSQQQTKSSSATKAATKKPIKIGTIFAVTGGASFLGAPEEKTVKMLVKQINDNGGVDGHQIEVIYKDSAGSPEKALSYAKQLIEEEKVLAIIGPSRSGCTMKIKKLCEESKTILISCAAAEVIVNPVAKHVFKTPQKDSQAVIKIFQTIKKLGIKNIGVAYGGTGFGKAGMGQIETLAKADKDIKIVIKEEYSPAATDLTGLLNKVKAAKVDAIINWSIVPAQAILIKNLRQMKWDIPLFQSHGFGNIKFVQMAGKAADGVIFPAGRLLVADVLPDSNKQKSLLVKYKKDYQDNYNNENVSTFGGHAYDALNILVKAIENAKSTETEKVRSAIENLKGFVGTGGIFNFSPEDHNGLDLDAFEMLTVKNGKFAIYSK